MRNANEVAGVESLIAAGWRDTAISQATGIPRSTIGGWRHGRAPRHDGPRHVAGCCECAPGTPPPPGFAYSYLLGLYLGDGCISRSQRTFRLRVSLDAAYLAIVNECADAIEAVAPGKRVWQGREPNTRCMTVGAYWNHWPCLFPQHGPGRKHLRRIALEEWQSDLIADERRALVRGLIHSDGCRIVTSDRGAESVRYHFSNLSEGIKTIYCESLDALGVRWTRPCAKQIAVYRKASVAILDTFVGPKS